MRSIKNIASVAALAVAAAFLGGCAAGGDNPGTEYAPNMYHSVAHEPLSQIMDEEAGAIVNALDNRKGEFFNSNKFNPNWMTMREPAPNTVKRNRNGWLPYRLAAVPKDSIPFVTRNLVSPFDSTATTIVADGKVLYESNCKHCHGAKGEGDGKVADKFPGVANLKGPSYLNITEGHIFHVITKGAGLMQPHGSQISPEDRWKIARYVKTLQK